LASEGFDVVAMGRNAHVGQQLRSLGVEFVAADINDYSALASAARGCTTVFHCAALAAPWGQYQNFYNVNVRGTAAVVQATLKANATLVHISTPSIYFDFRDRFDIDEYDPLPSRQVNAYAMTKLEAESYVDDAVSRCGLQAVTLRPRAIFGPYDTALFPRVLAASTNGKVPLVGKGETVIDVSCVSNVVDAMLLASERATSLSGKKYNITNGTPVFLRDLIALVFGRLGMDFRPRSIPYPVAYGAARLMEIVAASRFGNGEPKLTRYSAGVLRYHQTLSIKRAREELGYEPHMSTVAGVERFAEWRQSSET
jgi:nucleoside-diphosphate-sugar epimerase